jgi:hypothetical protein
MQEESTSPYVLLSAAILAFIPFLVFTILFFFNKALRHRSATMGIGGTGISFLLAIAVFVYTWPNTVHTFSLNWFTVGEYTFTIQLLIDKLSAAMLVLVSFISLLVQIYSTQYMRGDKRYSRYFAYLGLFTFSMFCIVLSGNLLLLYIGWELVGLSSYLLIGFWRERTDAALASRNAFLINRIGDTVFLLGIIILFVQFKTLDLVTYFWKFACHKPFLDDSGRHRFVLRMYRQVSPVSFADMATRGHGRTHTGICFDPCSHHGCRRCILIGPRVSFAECRCTYSDCHYGGHYGFYGSCSGFVPDGYKTATGFLYHFAARIHGDGNGCRRLWTCSISLIHPCLF